MSGAIVCAMQYCPLLTLMHNFMQSCPGLCKNRPVDISHVIHDMHLACKKIWRKCSVDQGRLIYCKDGFARGRTQMHMQMCPGGHNCIMQQRPGGHDCICKTVRLVLHRGNERDSPTTLSTAELRSAGTPMKQRQSLRAFQNNMFDER